jgi:hypothetical protein
LSGVVAGAVTPSKERIAFDPRKKDYTGLRLTRRITQHGKSAFGNPKAEYNKQNSGDDLLFDVPQS